MARKMESIFNHVVGQLRLFPEIAFSVPFRYSVRLLHNLAATVAVRASPSQFLPPVMLAAPPVMLVDDDGRQELLNGQTLELHMMQSNATEHTSVCVMEVPVTNWHSRDVQFLRFYYRHIEPTRLGLPCPETGEPAWKAALREIMDSSWLQRLLRHQTAGDGLLTNSLLSKVFWYQVSPRTIANYKGELRKTMGVTLDSPAPAGSALVLALDDYR